MAAQLLRYRVMMMFSNQVSSITLDSNVLSHASVFHLTILV